MLRISDIKPAACVADRAAVFGSETNETNGTLLASLESRDRVTRELRPFGAVLPSESDADLCVSGQVTGRVFLRTGSRSF